MKRFFVVLLLAVVLSLVPVGGVFAADDAVTVTATGEYVGFSNGPSTADLGTVAVDTSYWSESGLTPPTGPDLADGDCHFTVTNSSSVITNTTIGTTATWTGGASWTCSDTATPAEDTFGMKAGASGTAITSMVVVKPAATFETLLAALAANTNCMWEFEFLTPTVVTDGVEKSGTVTLTMTAAA